MISRRAPALAVVLLAAPHLLALSLSARAQEPPTQPEPPARQVLDTLADAFPFLRWDSQAHGLLIAVAADKVSGPAADPDEPGPPETGDGDPPVDEAHTALIAPAAGSGLSVSVVARHFGRNLVHLPSVTVFAPSMMVTLNRELKPANPYLGISPEDKIRHLEASLTTEQWQALGSPNGIGIGDMSREQEPLFAALLPENSRIQQMKFVDSDAGNGGVEFPENPYVELADFQREGLRIRLDRSAYLSLVDTHGQPQYAAGFHSEPDGAIRSEVVSGATLMATMSLFGQPVRFQTPSRLKPSDLDWKAAIFDVPAPVTGAATVGDLIAAVRKATGCEIYADGRLARLSVSVLGQDEVSARAADILKALAYALNATYRKIGTATNPKAVYILTFDREGLAVRRGRITEWAERGEAARRVAEAQLQKAVLSHKPGQYLAFAPGDLLTPTSAAQQAYDDANIAMGVPSITIPVSALSPTQQRQMQAGLLDIDRQRKANPEFAPDIRRDRVSMDLRLTLTFLVPGIGEIHSNTTWPDNTEDRKPVTALMEKALADALTRAKPIAGNRIILSVAAPHDRAEARAVVEAAASARVRQLWIRVPDSPDGPALLADCAAAGNIRHLPIVAVMSLMRAPKGSIPERWANVNLYGETGPAWAAHVAATIDGLESDEILAQSRVVDGDILDPVIADVQAGLTSRVRAIAATPGLAGLALTAAAAPGYHGSDEANYGRSYGDEFGYTTENRLAFLREEGYDPIDLDRSTYLDEEVQAVMRLPYFDTDGGDDLTDSSQPPDTSAARAHWQDFRAAQQRKLLRAVRAGLGAKAAALPIYISPDGVDNLGFGDGSYRLWAKPESDPFSGPSDSDLMRNAALRRSVYSVVAPRHEEYRQGLTLVPVFASRFSESMMVMVQVHEMLDPDPKLSVLPVLKPTNLVLDLGDYSVGQAVDLIKGAFLPAGEGEPK